MTIEIVDTFKDYTMTHHKETDQYLIKQRITDAVAKLVFITSYRDRAITKWKQIKGE